MIRRGYSNRRSETDSRSSRVKNGAVLPEKDSPQFKFCGSESDRRVDDGKVVNILTNSPLGTGSRKTLTQTYEGGNAGNLQSTPLRGFLHQSKTKTGEGYQLLRKQPDDNQSLASPHLFGYSIVRKVSGKNYKGRSLSLVKLFWSALAQSVQLKKKKLGRCQLVEGNIDYQLGQTKFSLFYARWLRAGSKLGICRWKAEQKD